MWDGGPAPAHNTQEGRDIRNASKFTNGIDLRAANLTHLGKSRTHDHLSLDRPIIPTIALIIVICAAINLNING